MLAPFVKRRPNFVGTRENRYRFSLSFLCMLGAPPDQRIHRRNAVTHDSDNSVGRTICPGGSVLAGCGHSHISRGQAIVFRGGDRPAECCVISKGFAFGPRTDVKRPGGKFSRFTYPVNTRPPSLHLNVLDHDSHTLTECSLGLISARFLREITAVRPNVRRKSFWRDTLIERRYVFGIDVNVGQRPRQAGCSHVVELRERLKVIGQVQGHGFEMPLNTGTKLGKPWESPPSTPNRIVKQLRDETSLEFSTVSVRVIDEQKF